MALEWALSQDQLFTSYRGHSMLHVEVDLLRGLSLQEIRLPFLEVAWVYGVDALLLVEDYSSMSDRWMINGMTLLEVELQHSFLLSEATVCPLPLPRHGKSHSCFI